MNKKELSLLIGNIGLFILSGIVYVFSKRASLSLLIIMGGYIVNKLSNFIINFKDKDYGDLFLTIISLGIFITMFLVDLVNKNVVLIFLIWLGLCSLVKLKKADYYHDRENIMWIYSIVNLFSFLITGLVISLRLNYPVLVSVKIITIFFMFTSILDMVEAFALYIKRGK